jgi:hypothetical protein
MANSTVAGQLAIPHSGSDPDLTSDFQDTQCQGKFTVLRGTADPIPFPGNIVINSAGVNAMTLAAPKAGPQSLGGDDGKSIFVVAQNAAAHTITCPANGIIGSKYLATFAAAVGNCIELRAYNGSWVPVASTGITVT